MNNKLQPLEPGVIYHVYNRANGNERMFLSKENYRFFLEKYLLYISPIADTFCYCLMPNHFHFLIRIKTFQELEEYFQPSSRPKFKTLDGMTRKDEKFKTLNGMTQKDGKFKTLDELLEKESLLSKQFSKFFSSYTQAFNKQQNRMGSMFMKNFKRLRVNDHTYLINLIHYIHFNPVESRLCNHPVEWKHSSYSVLLSEKETFLRRDEILEWYGSRENFRFLHEPAVDLYN
jgi:putative transposase